MRGRHKLFGYLQHFGTLRLFQTISPDSSGTCSIAVNLVRLENKFSKKLTCDFCLPELHAKVLQVDIRWSVQEILGWDSRRAMPKRGGGGGFGVIRAVGAATETQQAGELHAHFAIWLHGHLQRYMKHFSAINKVLRFLDTISTTDVPAIAHPDLCPKDAGILDPVEVGLEGFRRPVDGCPTPITARCTNCGSEYRDKDISDSAIGDLATKCGTILTDSYADYLKCRATRIDTPGSLEASLTQSVVIRDV
ncbi:hypothetical protein GQ600_11680 [Phytophthora cactorum]|nr:hypothetical protein GQ600_5884 [Phytophthora cactorum]KAF1780857.1 hypothetical protein GQ600_11680 [Phytophthora cactorum]